MNQIEAYKPEGKPIVIKKQGHTPSPQEIQNFIGLCNVLGTCPYYAKMGAGGVLAIYLSAVELGLPPMGCLNGGMYVIEGKVTISAQFMNMMIVNAGHRADVIYLSPEGCKIQFVRSDRQIGKGDTFEYEFTMQDAQRAGYLSKSNWKNSPRDMFYARCLSGGARKFMPDVLMNSYVIGEIEEEQKNEIDPVKPQEPLAVENQPDKSLVDFNEFVKRYDLNNSQNRKLHYINAIIEVCKKQGREKSFQEIALGCMRDEKKFLDSYGAWELKQISQRTGVHGQPPTDMIEPTL